MRRAVLHGVKDRMGERVGDTARRPASRYLGASGGHCGASFWEGESDPPTRPGQLGEGAAEPMAAMAFSFISSVTTSSIFTLGRRSTVYSRPR